MESDTVRQINVIDNILKNEGPCTRFNFLIHILVFLLSLAINGNNMIIVFTAHDGTWRCQTGNNSSTFCLENINKTFSTSDAGFYHRCQLKRSEWRFVEPKKYSFVTEFELVCEHAPTAAFLSSTYYIGGVVGALITGSLASFVGRKPVLLVTLAICFCSAFAGSFSKTIWELVVSNLAAGIGSYGCFAILHTYFLEVTPQSHRSLSNALFTLGMPLSFLLVDVLAYLLQEWRELKLYYSIPCAVLILPLLFIPESPRWLLANGKYEKATQMLKRILAVNNSNQELSIRTSDIVSRSNTTLRDLFGDRKRTFFTIAITFSRFPIRIVYNTLIIGSSNLGGDIYVSFALSVFPDVIATIICSIIGLRIERKKAWLGSVAVTTAVVICLACIPFDISNRYYINVALSMTAVFFVIISVDTAFMWTYEMYATPIRSHGMSFCIMIDRIGITATPFILKLLVRIHHSLPYITITALMVFSVPIVFVVLPETYNEPTREKMEDYTGKVREKQTTPVDNSGFQAGVTNCYIESVI